METLYRRCPICRPDDPIAYRGCIICHGTGFVEHGQVQPCLDHTMLDIIISRITTRCKHDWDIIRESECIEFTDPGGSRHYEIVVRPIDGRGETPEEASDG